MLEKKSHPGIFFANVFIFFLLIIFHTSELFDISIKTATPLLLLPLLTAFAIFEPVGASAAVGFITGAFLDSVADGSYCFNTLVLMLIGAFVSLFANNLFNKNIFAAAVLSLITCVIYYVLLWISFHLFGRTVYDSLAYLLSYAFPSAVYSAVFIFPFYFLYRHFNRIKTQ